MDVEFHPNLHFLTHQPNEPSGNAFQTYAIKCNSNIVRIELLPLVTNRVNMDTFYQRRILMKDQLGLMQGLVDS